MRQFLSRIVIVVIMILLVAISSKLLGKDSKTEKIIEKGAEKIIEAEIGIKVDF